MHGKNPKLNGLNFFAADVGDGIGPFLAIYLGLAGWSMTSIGLALMILNLSTVLLQTPAGLFIDESRKKRSAIAWAATLIGLACVAIPLFPDPAVVLTSVFIIGASAAVIPPAISAITLGMVGTKGFTEQVGVNQGYNHAGNVFAALGVGLLGKFFSGAEFLMVAGLCVGTVIMVWSIAESRIDHDLARGGTGLGNVDPEDSAVEEAKAEWTAIFHNKTLLIFAGCVALFHLANAAMLPLAGQKLSVGRAHEAPLYMSGCVIIAQFVMIPTALLVGRYADVIGRKPIFLIGFLILPLRGILFGLVSNPWEVMAIQILDGLAAGIYGATFILVVADLTHGQGCFNLAQGFVMMTQGLGASFSNFMGEALADKWGMQFAFLTLAGLAAFAFLLYLILVPETLDRQTLEKQDVQDR